MFSARLKYGTRDKFDYWECLACGCLQVIEIPPNIGAYYLDDFYSSSLRFWRSGTMALSRFITKPRISYG